MKGQVALLLLCAALHALGPAAFAQDEYSIRVESNQVLVPVFVFDKKRIPFFSSSWDDFEIRDLTLKDFHLFEDGIEQTINKTTGQSWLPYPTVSDNFGPHSEFSDTPRGKWRSADLGPGWGEPAIVYFYLVAYVPPPSANGSCHRIEVKVDRRNALVSARGKYCNTAHAASDPLNGTKFGQQIENDGATGQSGKIALSLQTSYFYTDFDTARVDIALDFPWNSLKREWSNESVGGMYALHAKIGVLATAYRQDGVLAARVSGFACCSSALPVIVPGHLPGDPPYTGDASGLPTSYEAQIDLPPGEYTLRVVLSDGSKFGLAQSTLTVDRYDHKHLGISTIVLCKRFKHAVASQEAAAADQVPTLSSQEAVAAAQAPKLVRMVSKGVEFVPAGDTRFKKGEPMFAYFEVYKPLLGGTPAATVQTHIKITNVKTGELKVDTGLRSEASVSPVIPITEQIAVDKLPAGSYKLEVQASDSGKSTVWRAANFTVE